MPPPAAGVERFDLSGAWQSLLSPDKLLNKTMVILRTAALFSSGSNGDNEDEPFRA
jgi:hypothetical protein